jgi:hypothetical protein
MSEGLARSGAQAILHWSRATPDTIALRRGPRCNPHLAGTVRADGGLRRGVRISGSCTRTALSTWMVLGGDCSTWSSSLHQRDIHNSVQVIWRPNHAIHLTRPPRGIGGARRLQAATPAGLAAVSVGADHLHRLQTVYDDRFAREYGPWRPVVAQVADKSSLAAWLRPSPHYAHRPGRTAHGMINLPGLSIPGRRP